MMITIARFILHAGMIFLVLYYLYIWVIEILMHNKFLYGKYFPKEKDYREFVKRHDVFNDDVRKR
ncbi:hypothetical protein [Bacillus cereus]|uniref:hypothetical protein n=1 Tax=Bacillus cereus TaxID=1396 RepID=UPI001F2A8F26|nr:hypothetical protein [Bacillus cereus]BCC44632.1 hypothetical protein BCJMU01_p209 [Bacillus cereus]